MPILTRKRLERQKYDDGADSDTVYVGFSNSRHHHKRTQRRESKVYHDDPDCWILVDRYDEVHESTRVGAKNRWKAPCRGCVVPDAPEVE